ncbi:MAG: Spy/CpxP family protein refolding chaperone [Pseudomonadales bacterium]|nr:Spy/CpxP family protein refolding chaperone [Pseudomonadales bacterium]
MNKRQWIIASVFAGTMGVAGLTHAFGGYGDSDGYSDEDRCNGKKGEHKGKHRGGFGMRGFKHLDLTDEQQTVIKAIKTESRGQMKTTRSELSDIQKSLHEQSSADTYDASKVRELADAEAKLMSDIVVQRIQTKHNIRKELTGEQLIELEKQQSERDNKDHHGKHRRF